MSLLTLCRSVPWWAHLRACSLEGEQALSHLTQTKISGRRQVEGMLWNDYKSVFLSFCSVISPPQQFCFSNFSCRIGLLRYFLLDTFTCLFFSTQTHTRKVFPQKTLSFFFHKKQKAQQMKKAVQKYYAGFLVSDKP